MKNTIQQGDWWNDVSVKYSVVLADFSKKFAYHKLLGKSPRDFVYNADARLQLMRAYGHADI